MRMPRNIVTVALAGVLALGACDAASRHQGGDPAEQGGQGGDETGAGTIANDTAPARPGQPSPQEVQPAPGSDAAEKEP